MYTTVRDRGLSFDAAAEFDFESALYAVDDRLDWRKAKPTHAR